MHYRDLRKENPKNFIDDLTHPVVCAECGKEFEIRFLSEYAYKTRVRADVEGRISAYRYYCSWHCYREVDKRKPPKPLKGENVLLTRQRYEDSRKAADHHGFMTAMPQEELEKVYSLYKSGMHLKEIAAETGRSYDTIRRKLQRAGLIEKKRGRARLK